MYCGLLHLGFCNNLINAVDPFCGAGGLESYAFPGGMMIRTNGYIVNTDSLGMVAIGVGEADAVDVMAGMPWELRLPNLSVYYTDS